MEASKQHMEFIYLFNRKSQAASSVLTSVCLRSIMAAVNMTSNTAWTMMRPSFKLVLYWAFARLVDSGGARVRVSADISRCQRRTSLSSFLTGNLELCPTPPGVVNLAEVDSFVLHVQIADVEFGAWARNAKPPSRLHLLGFVTVFVVLVELVPLHHVCRGRAANAHLALCYWTDEPRPLAEGLGPCAGTF